MKDSGIEWIGKIPDNWKITRISNVYSLRNQKVSDYDYIPLSVTNKGILLQLETAAKSNAHNDRKLVLRGDFAINSRSDRRGSCGISKYDGSVSLINIVLKPTNQIYPKYYDFLFHTIQFGEEFYKFGHGIVDDLWTTTWQDMKKISIPFPPPEIQKKIANFLDDKCAKVDSLSSDIKKQIEILEQYKKSIITEAVTGARKLAVNGEELIVNSHKSTNSKWLSKIPSQWKMEKLKYNLKVHEAKGYREKEVLSLYREYGVVPKKSRDDNHNVTSEDTSKYKYVRVGDFVINKMKAWQGSVAVSGYEGIVSPAYYIYEFTNEKYNKRYFHYLMRNKILADEFRRISGGIREDQWDLDRIQFENMYLPMPPINEQKQIVDYLDAKCAKIDSIIIVKKQQVEKLEEYKKSLIFEYVTGKKEL